MSRRAGPVRILYIAPSIPYPLNNGMALRGYHMLRAYSTVGVVKLVCFAHDDGGGVEGVREYCEDVYTVPKRTILHRKHGAGWRARWEIARTLTPAIAGNVSPQLTQLAAQWAGWADVVHVAKLWMVPTVEPSLARRPRRAGTILDLDDVETVVRTRALTVNRPARWQRRVFERYDLLRLRWYQRRALSMFDRVLICSERDRKLLGQQHVVVIPNGATCPERALPDEPEGRTLLYVGNFAYSPNVDGLSFLVRDVLPLIRREIPDVRLLVVGRMASETGLGLQKDTSIHVVSDPPTLEPYYRQASVSVVSLRIGGGTRLRILEALALGRPVVSTSVGCEGLEVTDGEHLLIGDDSEGLARRCVALLRDPALRQRLAVRGRELVEEKYTWDSIESRVRSATEELLAARHV